MIRYSKQAQKFLAKQEKTVRWRIETAIQALPAGDVKKMEGQPLIQEAENDPDCQTFH